MSLAGGSKKEDNPMFHLGGDFTCFWQAFVTYVHTLCTYGLGDATQATRTLVTTWLHTCVVR